MLHPQTTPPVPVEIAGEVLIPVRKLAAKLGRAAFHVWQVLLKCRDQRGVTHITTRGIAQARGFERLTERNVKKGLARLRKAGLVEDLGKHVTEVPKHGARPVRIMVYLRRVYGARTIPQRGEHLAVITSHAAASIRGFNTHGGRRLGAGRPCSYRSRGTDKPCEVPYKINQEGPHSPIQEGPPNWLIGCSPHSVSLPPASGRRKRDTDAGAKRAAPEAFLVSGNVEDGESVVDSKTPELSGLVEGESGIGSFFESRGKPPKFIYLLGGPLPPFPGPEVVPEAVVPDPPELPEDLSPKSRLDRLQASHRGVVRSRYGNGARVPHLASKDRACLLAAAEKLIEHWLAPAAWAAWSCDIWIHREEEKNQGAPSLRSNTPPPIAWVFSPKRIEKYRGWFREDGGNRLGGRVISSRASDEITRRFFSMQDELRRAPAIDVETVLAMKERWFPGDSWNRLLVDAHASAARIEDICRKRIAKGEYVWE